MIISINSRSPVPPYEQLRAQIIAMVSTSTLQVGDRLPPIRQLAGDLGLAPGTVSRAFRELERDGILETRGRHGTFVLNNPHRLSEVDRRNQLQEAAEEFALRAQQLSLPVTAAIAALKQAMQRLT